MVFCYIVLLLVSVSIDALATPGTLHEKRQVTRHGRRARVHSDAILPIRIALQQSNLDQGHTRLMEVSHPSSSSFGQHLTAAEVHDLFAPSEESVWAVKDWLIESGIAADQIADYENKGWLAVDMPAGLAENLFKTDYYEYEVAGTMRIGCDEYYLPAHISKHVDFIKPGVTFTAPLRKRDASGLRRAKPGVPRLHGNPFPEYTPSSAVLELPSELQQCGVNITPICIQALYGLPPPPLAAKFLKPSPENTMGLYESGDAFAIEDIKLFFENYAPWVPSDTVPTVLSIDGGVAPVAPGSIFEGGESDVDIDLAQSIIYPQSLVIYQTDDIPFALGEVNVSGGFNTFLDAVDGSYCTYTAYGITGDSPGVDPTYPDTLPGGFDHPLECGVYNLTRVVSISYGGAEIDLPKRYLERQCNEFMKLGLQGHTILVASGDYGVASFPDADGNEFGCLSGNGQNGTIYNPDEPAGCPYLTVVGATRLYPNDTVFDRESAMQVNLTAFNLVTNEGPVTPPYDFFASSGGFSNYFSIPSYQANAVSNYLAQHAPDVRSYVVNADATNIGANGGVYNRAGRAYPDVSANGAFLLDYQNLTLVNIFGTSLSSPIFGGVMTLINEARTVVGKNPVGFINPVLYENPQVLNDIVNGSNPNCGSSGFSAAPGWDPVTGLGTPNFPKMLELWLSLP